MKLESLVRLPRNARRVSDIVAVLAKYGLADWLKGLPYAWIQDRLFSVDGQPIGELRPEERLRLALTDLGTTFIKLGQVLSTRSDLVGPEVAAELSKLQTQTPADPTEVVRATIATEFGKSPEELFGSFDPGAMASASIAQVHRARLKSGEDVVVKVQLAGILDTILSDLEILAGLAELAEKHAPQLRFYQPVATVQHVRRRLLRELDFTYERRNLEEFTQNFESDDTVRFPRSYRELSGRRVLTMERFEGIAGADPAALANSGVDLVEFAQRGASMYLDMIFRDSFYHADPHPGNLMLLPGGVVGVIDCGMAGRLDETLREEIETLLLAAVQKDTDELTETVLRLGGAPPDCPRDRLRADLNDFLADYVGQSLRDLDLSAALNNLMEIIRRYHITLPPPITLMLRTVVVLEGTSRRLNPEFSLAELMPPFYVKLVRRRFAPQRILTKVQRAYRDWERLLECLPRDLGDLLGRMRNGTLNVHLDHRHLDPVINRLVLGVVTAALFLGSSLLWSMKAPPALGGVSVFGAMSYLLAVYFGWRLFRAIKKSGDIDSKD